MPSTWHRLHLSGDLPPLLFQYTCTQQGYEIFLTDLTYIWTEQLFYKDIVKRAEEEAATIDPGEDPEQLKVLLEKIGEALQKGQESIVLSSGTQTDSLKLTTTTKLPAPLKPLKWPLKLSKEPLSAVTTRLLIPMLEEEAERESRQRSLLSQIKQKDYVLGKLFDKIESLGAELGSVFPSAAGSRTSRKGNTRSEAGKFVKGIAPFDEEAWLAEVRSSDGSGLGSNIFQEISESGKLENLENINQQGEWWCRLRRHPQTHTRKAIPLEAEEVATSPKKQAIIAQLQHQDEGESMADSDHDEFERQETPPHLKRQYARETTASARPKAKTKSPSPTRPSEADEATASDTDSGPELEPSPAPRNSRIPRISSEPKPATPASLPLKVREAPKSKGGLGVIGGKKKKEPEQEPVFSPPNPGDQSNLPEEENNNQVRPVFPSPAPAPVRPKRTGKLGMIGGKAKAKVSQPPQDEDLSQAEFTSPEKLSPAKPNLAQEDDTTEATAQQTIKRETLPLLKSAVGKASTNHPSELETDDQRASRKREELKRQLEAKSKAPAKKKRRF